MVYFNIKGRAQWNISRGSCFAALQKWSTECGSMFDLPCKVEELRDQTDWKVRLSGIDDEEVGEFET